MGISELFRISGSNEPGLRIGFEWHQICIAVWDLVLVRTNITVVTARFAHPILDSPTLQGCLSKMADPADGWVRMGGQI